MKNRIEYRELKNMGATEKQLETYNSTDPLTIYEEDGKFSIRGVFEVDDMSAAEVLELLDTLAE